METTSHPVRQVAELATFLHEKFPDLAPKLDAGEPTPVELAIDLLSRVDMLEQMWAAQLALNTTTFESNPSRCTDEKLHHVSFFDVLDAANNLKESEQDGDEISADDAAFVEKWIVNYCTAMLQEIAELRDSTNWKWCSPR